MLGHADPILEQIIQRVGSECLTSRGDAFTTLARAIVGQQISVKAADSVWARVRQACAVNNTRSRLTPTLVLNTSPSDLRGAGLSQAKMTYLVALAQWFDEQPRLAQTLARADDAEVKRLLVARPGIGPWTADMFLIFTLMRPDIFPDGDLGVIKGMGLLYYNGVLPSRSQAIAHAEQWRPYRTAASWLLWRSLDPVPVTY
ncbi:MAG: putative glycosylase [Pseudomonadota bacterium]|jgi:DNA-3-methyladenine glycosylase II